MPINFSRSSSQVRRTAAYGASCAGARLPARGTRNRVRQSSAPAPCASVRVRRPAIRRAASGAKWRPPVRLALADQAREGGGCGGGGGGGAPREGQSSVEAIEYSCASNQHGGMVPCFQSAWQYQQVSVAVRRVQGAARMHRPGSQMPAGRNTAGASVLGVGTQASSLRSAARLGGAGPSGLRVRHVLRAAAAELSRPRTRQRRRRRQPAHLAGGAARRGLRLAAGAVLSLCHGRSPGGHGRAWSHLGWTTVTGNQYRDWAADAAQAGRGKWAETRIGEQPERRQSGASSAAWLTDKLRLVMYY